MIMSWDSINKTCRKGSLEYDTHSPSFIINWEEFNVAAKGHLDIEGDRLDGGTGATLSIRYCYDKQGQQSSSVGPPRD